MRGWSPAHSRRKTARSNPRNRKPMCVDPGNGLSTQRSGGPVKTATFFFWRTAEGCSLQQIGSDKPIVQWRPTGSALSSVHRLPSITGSSCCTEIFNSADETNLIFQTVIFLIRFGAEDMKMENGGAVQMFWTCFWLQVLMRIFSNSNRVQLFSHLFPDGTAVPSWWTRFSTHEKTIIHHRDAEWSLSFLTSCNFISRDKKKNNVYDAKQSFMFALGYHVEWVPGEQAMIAWFIMAVHSYQLIRNSGKQLESVHTQQLSGSPDYSWYIDHVT